MGNLGLTHITYAPGYTSVTHPAGPATFTDDEWIDVFYKRYSFWILKPVESLVANVGADAGFAILFMVYPYFEMIGRYNHGRKPKPRTDEYQKFFGEGFCEVFDKELNNESPQICSDLSGYVYTNLRNDIAHGNFTGKGMALSDDGNPALYWEFDMNNKVCGVLVNPRLWVERIRNHFENYKSRLLNPVNKTSREKFLNYAKRDYEQKAK